MLLTLSAAHIGSQERDPAAVMTSLKREVAGLLQCDVEDISSRVPLGQVGLSTTNRYRRFADSRSVKAWVGFYGDRPGSGNTIP